MFRAHGTVLIEGGLVIRGAVSADPVEALSFPVKGIEMSDFVYPSYFEDFHKPGSVKFDQLGKVKKPFEVLKDGYQIVFRNGKWSQIYGSARKARAFAKEDRRGHRSEQRRKVKLERANPAEIRRRQAAGERARAAANRLPNG